MKTHSRSNKNLKYRIPQRDSGEWEEFIRNHNGIDCTKMCEHITPTQATQDLLQNPAAGHVFCRWCNRS